MPPTSNAGRRGAFAPTNLAPHSLGIPVITVATFFAHKTTTSPRIFPHQSHPQLVRIFIRTQNTLFLPILFPHYS